MQQFIIISIHISHGHLSVSWSIGQRPTFGDLLMTWKWSRLPYRIICGWACHSWNSPVPIVSFLWFGESEEGTRWWMPLSILFLVSCRNAQNFINGCQCAVSVYFRSHFLFHGPPAPKQSNCSFLLLAPEWRRRCGVPILFGFIYT